MKPIKFRAWDGVRMYEVVRLDTESVYGVCEDPTCLVKTGEYEDGYVPLYKTLYVPEVELMQYTGLQDRNGVDIFEGDILHLDYARIEGGRLGTVFAVPGGFGWETFEDEVGQRYLTGYEDMGNKQNAQWLEETAEVIGNIYENPELLEVKK